jgi:hypothetical protein
MAKKFIWKAWLKPNLLTKDVDNDYIAEVSTTGKTLRNEDIAQIIKDEGSELQYETLFDILNHSDRLRRERIQQGYSVQTGVCHLSPRVTGNWIGSSANFDPKVHKITCDLTPAAELRHALEEVGVEVLGVKENGARIGLVLDVSTGKTDGTISPMGEMIITGEKIKVAPDGEAGPGIFFEAADGSQTQAHTPFILNDPKRIIAQVPNLAPGTYTLKIVTRFSQGNVLLKEARTITYGQPLIVV